LPASKFVATPYERSTEYNSYKIAADEKRPRRKKVVLKNLPMLGSSLVCARFSRLKDMR